MPFSSVLAVAVTLASAAPSAPSPARFIPSPVAATSSSSGRVTGAAFAAFARRVPSFSRQTKLPCGACHNGFPALNAFGRLFKLNGYTMTGLPTIDMQLDSASRKQLQLSPIAPLAVMAVAGGTKLAKAVPGTSSFSTEFPQQFSFFAASGISPKMGIFSQLTYSGQDGTFGIDNIDLRYASHATVGGHDLLYGVSVNNNPTVQDVWNTTPAWGFPFIGSEAAPSPAAATKIEGAYAQSVVGVGAYTLLNSTLYAELSGYAAAPQGAAQPLDSSARNTPRSVSPYWRLALQHQYADTYLMVGAFGMSSHVYPAGMVGATDHFNDVGLDAQVERRVGTGTLIGRASYIHESQTLPASLAAAAVANATNTLSTYRANVTYQPSLAHAITAGLFSVSGSADATLYPSGDVTGSATGRPNSAGFIVDGDMNAWMNVRLGAQYVGYTKFNGGSTSYDVPSGGRSAKDNNTLYLYLWLAF